MAYHALLYISLVLSCFGKRQFILRKSACRAESSAQIHKGVSCGNGALNSLARLFMVSLPSFAHHGHLGRNMQYGVTIKRRVQGPCAQFYPYDQRGQDSYVQQTSYDQQSSYNYDQQIGYDQQSSYNQQNQHNSFAQNSGNGQQVQSSWYLQATMDFLNPDYANGEIGFRAGDVIEVLQGGDPNGWWWGTVHNQVGWFPSSLCSPYVAQQVARPPSHDIFDPRSKTQTYEQWYKEGN